MDKYKVIESVDKGSIAEEIGLCKGDCLVEINGKKVKDILQYKYYSREEEITLKIKKANGEIEIIDIENPDYEDLGINFQYPLLSCPRSCRNKCVFCFIDQLPKGMRETLYFKDDDSRLSLLHGNYVTLTNLSDEEIKEMANMHISPINISVHTTDPENRKLVFGHGKSGDILARMKFFAENGITMNGQIVLCKNVNDGKYLEKTLNDLCGLYPAVYSVSVVPVGLSKYREGLYPLEPFNKEEATEVIKLVEGYQQKMLEKHNSRVIYLADEFYLKAELPVPQAEAYEDFPQIENGVGLIASLKEEFEDALSGLAITQREREVSIATGKASYPLICSFASRLEEKVKGLKINVYEIKNDFFGELITVSGLICGCDLMAQLKGKNLGQELFISHSMLRSGEDVFLDDVTLKEIISVLKVPVTPVYNDGYEFVDLILGEE
ncbi:MAG: DUF512 domain-containing protein [Clostridia bacterium]|nr:DUF512 domain-containing protein [Clostridia bacterium]